jgi:hypothetical protein
MYNLGIHLYALGVAVASHFNKKVSKMWRGEHDTFRILKEKADPNSQKNISCKSNLFKVMFNGRLFTDELTYDMSHRAAGGKEMKLHDNMSMLLKLIGHYGKIDTKTFIHNNEQEVQA